MMNWLVAKNLENKKFLYSTYFRFFWPKLMNRVEIVANYFEVKVRNEPYLYIKTVIQLIGCLCSCHLTPQQQ
ncbi:hypothetical protein ATY35_08505 [Vibrio cidicii]|uniref:Uncharacterized protein n=1 Tax=Vibrio cidicii TaxID=1763883 RepID=A0ABR5W8K0_9VIBR|nr:hypothetical protein ATY35_08505 [Vibrio cidicii]MBE4618810.1 hypothetical protein [Vibrio navarrensis]